MRMPSSASALSVASASFLLGGLGNVAFSAHSGSVTGLVLVRFALGALLARAFLRWRRPARPDLRPVKRARLWMNVAAASEAGAVVLIVAASQYVSTLLFTLVNLAGTAALAMLGRRLSLGSGTRAQIFVAAAAVIAAAASVLASSDISTTTSLVGLALAVASTVLGVVSALAGATAASVRHPAEILSVICLWGCTWAVVLLAFGAPFSVTWSTVTAAAFIALLPGGIAKVGIYWALARTAPYLVSACSSVALLTAGLGGWLVLDEVPQLLPTLLALVAAALVALLNLLSSRVTPVR